MLEAILQRLGALLMYFVLFLPALLPLFVVGFVVVLALAGIRALAVGLRPKQAGSGKPRLLAGVRPPQSTRAVGGERGGSQSERSRAATAFEPAAGTTAERAPYSALLAFIGFVALCVAFVVGVATFTPLRNHLRRMYDLLAANPPKSRERERQREQQKQAARFAADAAAAEEAARSERARYAAEVAADAEVARTMQAQLVAIAAAQAAYRSANGGFYDNLGCLARPATCIPGYSGAAFLHPEPASLKPGNGYVLTFHPGPPAPDGAARSSSSLRTYAVMARPEVWRQGGRFPYRARLACIDPRARLRFNVDYMATQKHGVCATPADGIGIFPPIVDFRHEEGKSKCPQHIGAVVVSNSAPYTIASDIRTAMPAPLSFGRNVRISGPGSKSIDIFYTCPKKRESFEAEVQVLVPQDFDPERVETKLLVIGTVKR